jgi:manganese-dependent inorganic pyrophosphatase
MKSTIVIGHKNPDTDSICSAICYAHFKSRLTGEEYIPCRAGELNNETQFVLEHFGVEPPRLIQSLEPRIADVQYRQVEGISPGISLRRAWGHMRDANIQTLPVVTKRGKIKGIITLGDEARFYLEDQDPRALSKANTPYQNIASTLWGEILVGDPEGRFMKGKVVIAAAHPSVIEDNIDQGDLVLLGSNTDVQRYAIDHGAGCIVICVGSKVTPSIRMRAQAAGCTVIVSPMDMYACAKLIIQAMPVSHVMRKDEIITFNLDDLVTEVKATVSKLRIRYFPVLDNGGNYVGMISQRNLLDIDKQRVILVDHNERGQAVDGLRGAEVVEIIDHHRIDAVETINPIYFRAQPLGCTSTIISMMFREHHIEIEPVYAGLMCSAIISDTLMFRSPTCTPADEAAARMLAAIAGINIEEYAVAMFNAGSNLGKKTPDEIFHLDCKKFKAASASIIVAQITSVSSKELMRVHDRLIPYMQGLLPQSGADMLFLMLTNIFEESTRLVFVGQGAKGVVQAAFDNVEELKNNSVLLPGVVSRKKQIVGPLITAIDEM